MGGGYEWRWSRHAVATREGPVPTLEGGTVPRERDRMSLFCTTDAGVVHAHQADRDGMAWTVPDHAVLARDHQGRQDAVRATIGLWVDSQDHRGDERPGGRPGRPDRSR